MNCSEIKGVRLHPEGDRRHAAIKNQHQVQKSIKYRPEENLKGFPLRLSASKHCSSAAIFHTNTLISGTVPRPVTHNTTR